MLKELENAKEIYIYHKGCYGCGRSAHLYDTLQCYLASQLAEVEGYKLPKYQVRRIDFDTVWQDEIESAGLNTPAVKIIKEDKTVLWIAYKELEAKIKKEEDDKNK